MEFLPKSFLDIYLQELRTCDSWSDYWSDATSWTRFTLNAAKNACKNLGLVPSTEDLRLDLLGVEKMEKYANWHLRVAYEHENNSDWRSELCKLSHVIADLRVLVYYDHFKNRKVETNLQIEIDKLKDRVMRFYPQMKWLFICGPRKGSEGMAFRAFTLNEQGQIVELKPSGDPLVPPSNADFT